VEAVYRLRQLAKLMHVAENESYLPGSKAFLLTKGVSERALRNRNR